MGIEQMGNFQQDELSAENFEKKEDNVGPETKEEKEKIKIETKKKNETIEKPDILYRAFTINPDNLSLEISTNTLAPGNINKEDPTKINDGNELGVYMSTNLSMVEFAYTNTPLGLNIKGPIYNNGGSMTDEIPLPQCGIIAEIDTSKLSIRKPKLAPHLESVYNNGFEGDEWIADSVPSSQYKIIRLVLSSSANDSKKYVVNVENKEGGLEEAIEKIKAEFNERKEEANRYKLFLEGLEEKKRLNAFFLKNEWERVQNQNSDNNKNLENRGREIVNNFQKNELSEKVKKQKETKPEIEKVPMVDAEVYKNKEEETKENIILEDQKRLEYLRQKLGLKNTEKEKNKQENKQYNFDKINLDNQKEIERIIIEREQARKEAEIKELNDNTEGHHNTERRNRF